MVDNLRAVLSRRAFTSQEIGVMRGVISSLDRFSRKRPRGSGAPATDFGADGADAGGGDADDE
ncbi:hypothetical protein D3C87_2063550 [compost metagenome]